MNKWTRRTVLATGGLLGGGLALGVAGIAFAPNRLRVTPDGHDGTPQLTTWVKIGADNTVSVVVPHCEMGTGVQTALAMMCAEELEADWNLVRFEEAPGTDDYANGYLVRVFVPAVASMPKYMERGIDFWTFKLTEMMDLQVTGGSSAVRGTGHLGMRVAGAAAKAMLVEAAAKQWKVPVAECTAKLSRVTHSGSGRSATYGELAPQAALLTPPGHPQLKSRDSYTIVGKPTQRIDIPAKVNGSATYGVDVTLPDMVYATIAAAPVFGAKLVSVDTAPAEALPGVKKVVKLDNAVAVVADGYWRALKGVRALAPKFEQTGNDQVTSETI
jgi:isoquinoline 1-oxidoreductase subunit beta